MTSLNNMLVQVSIAFAKYIAGYRPHDELWSPLDQEAFDFVTAQTPSPAKEMGERRVAAGFDLAAAAAVKRIFELSLLPPDSGFTPEDVAQACAAAWNLPTREPKA